jgi:hypothetical protein
MPSLYERVLISIGQTFREEPKKEKVYPVIQTTHLHTLNHIQKDLTVLVDN